MLQQELNERARALLDLCRGKRLKLAAAESCTGGLLAATLTEIPGSSDVFERGFITYSNEAKKTMLGVASATLQSHGAVSSETAAAMARGVLAHTPVDLAVSITGIAGPGGAVPGKPVGLVHLAAASRNRRCGAGKVANLVSMSRIHTGEFAASLSCATRLAALSVVDHVRAPLERCREAAEGGIEHGTHQQAQRPTLKVV